MNAAPAWNRWVWKQKNPKETHTQGPATRFDAPTDTNTQQPETARGRWEVKEDGEGEEQPSPDLGAGIPKSALDFVTSKQKLRTKKGRES